MCSLGLVVVRVAAAAAACNGRGACARFGISGSGGDLRLVVLAIRLVDPRLGGAHDGEGGGQLLSRSRTFRPSRKVPSRATETTRGSGSCMAQVFRLRHHDTPSPLAEPRAATLVCASSLSSVLYFESPVGWRLVGNAGRQ